MRHLALGLALTLVGGIFTTVAYAHTQDEPQPS